MIWIKKIFGERVIEIIATAIAILLMAFGIWVMTEQASGFSLIRTQSPEPLIEIEVNYLDSQPQYIKDLIKCESRGNSKAIHYNDGGSHSYGLVQWKEDSFYRYNKIYKVLPDLERYEVLNIIMDETAQIELAKKVIENGGWRNWLNCGLKIGLSKVDKTI